MCLVHREGMTGKIVVVDASQSVPTPDAQAAVGQADLAKSIAGLQPALGPLGQGKNPELGPFLASGPKIVLAGDGSQAVQEGQINQFGPTTVTASVGSTLTWIVIGDHTVAFNAPTDAQGIRTPGTSQLNHKAIDPVGGPGQTTYPNPPPGPPSSSAPPPPPTVVKGGSFDGNGFRSSGVIFSFPPVFLTEYQLTFTKKGTFPYKCLVHDGMKATVTIQ
jgi:plastocyanin